MSASFRIVSSDGTKNGATVSSIGQLVTAKYAYDQSSFMELAADDTAYNFYGPRTGKQFVITGMRLKANRQVSATADATVIIYEASSASTTTVDKILHEEVMVRGESVSLLPVNIIVNAGKFINGKTTDDDIFATILGYYIPKLA